VTRQALRSDNTVEVIRPSKRHAGWGALRAASMSLLVAVAMTGCSSSKPEPLPVATTTTVVVTTSSTTPLVTAPRSQIALPAPPNSENSALCVAFRDQQLSLLLLAPIQSDTPDQLRERFTTGLDILRQLTPDAPIDQSNMLILTAQYFADLNEVIAPYNYDLNVAATDPVVAAKITPTPEQDQALTALDAYERGPCKTTTLPLITAPR